MSTARVSYGPPTLCGWSTPVLRVLLLEQIKPPSPGTAFYHIVLLGVRHVYSANALKAFSPSAWGV